MSLQFHLDRITTDGLEGWAWDPQGIRQITILRDGVELGHAIPGLIRRPDVHAALRHAPESDALGFSFLFPPATHPSGDPTRNHKVFLDFLSSDGTVTRCNTPDVPCAGTSGLPTDESLRLPFPRAVTVLIQRKLSSGTLPPKNDSALEEIVDRIIYLARHGPTEWRPLRQYLLYLKTVQARFDAMKASFPTWNLLSEAGRKDFNASATSADEMLPIAHHLYVLQSYGLTGDLCEFGCFKGCSTSMLSFACRQLGLRMQVFDSFEGLPPSESGYYRTAEFKGGIDEVRTNVAAFGAPEVVTFHQGYFSLTLPHSQVQPLLIWMDVDLETSAADVMTLLPRLPRASAVFSHECPARCFSEGAISQEKSADSVLPPIVDAFEKDGRTPVGRHLFDCTGAVWDAGAGVPVLPPHLIRRLANG